MPNKHVFSLFFILYFLRWILCDEITVYSPPTNGIYHQSDVMDIRYRVRSVGMTRLWSTSAKLTHISTNTTIPTFPLVQWSASKGKSIVHQTWTVPSTLSNGNYSLVVGGNTTFLCSKNGDGSAPFTQCHSQLFAYTTFIITNSGSTSS